MKARTRGEYVQYKELLRTFNPIDISILKSILDGEGITYYFLGEHFSYVRPLLEPARLMVATDHYDRAAEIIEDLDLAITFSSGTPRKRRGKGSK